MTGDDDRSRGKDPRAAGAPPPPPRPLVARGQPVREGARGSGGFALVLTLALLALLVLTVFGLASLGRVDTQLATTAVFQTQARQNALLGLAVALGELQKHAGVDDRATAMAGVTGVPAGVPGNQQRQWCGVWDATGAFQAWLASGSSGFSPPALAAGTAAVVLVANGSVGAEATNSEHVAVGRVPVAPIDSQTGLPRDQGGYAYWVGDEGVKISAYSPDLSLALPGVRPLLATTPAVSLTLKNSLLTWSARLPQVLSYEQLRLLPSPGAPLSNSTLWDNFHQVTLTSYQLQAQGPAMVPRSGTVNVNTTSQPVWNSLATTYNAVTASVPITNPSTVANRMRDNLPTVAAAGKPLAGPFLSVAAFESSGVLTIALNGQGPTPAQFMAAIGPLLATRSDTFRIRAYGDAVSPADVGETEAVAYCEAIVQRTPDLLGGPFGRRFVVTYFRWLGVDDI